MTKQVSILGCGWLGFPLARAMMAAGWEVRGSTRSGGNLANLKAAGIQAFKIILGENAIEGNMKEFLGSSALLIISVPPGLRSGSGEDYVKKMALVQRSLAPSQVKQLVFVSSTSVYGNITGQVTEQTSPAPVTESGRQVLDAENVFRNDRGLETIIIRFGGLIGPNRHPVTHLSGKSGLRGGDDPVNLIHQEDAILLIQNVVRDNHWNMIFNGVYPAHPKKKVYYNREARKRNLSAPEYQEETNQPGSKIVISKNYLTYNYSFYASIFG